MTFARRLLRTCSPAAFAVAVLVLSAAPATANPFTAGCQSGVGNNTTTFPLASGVCQGNATGTLATAVGKQARAAANLSTALGYGASAHGHGATALGSLAGPFENPVVGATSVGFRAGQAGAGIYSTAIGAGVTDGPSTRATGAYSIAIGGGDGANFDPLIVDIVIPLNGARATGFISTAIGTASVASGGGSSAFGLYSRAIANDSAAFGEFSTARGANSIAMGLFSDARVASSIALGTQTIASGLGSVAIGNKSIATVANTVSVGSPTLRRRIVNVAPAVASTDAVNLAQAKALIAAASSAAPVAQAEPVNELRREVAELRLLVQQQQAQIAALLGQKEVAALAD